MSQSRVEQQDHILAIEIGELAAWVTVQYGRAWPGKRWRAHFSAPPGLDELLARIQSGARELTAEPATSVGVASWGSPSGPGPVYLSEWESDGALAASLRDMLGGPVSVRHAALVAALAESRDGVAETGVPVVYIHLGREVLGVIVSGGHALTGAQGTAGQIGHWRVSDGGPRCACGQRGHLNPMCSSQGFVRLAIGLVSQHDDALAAATAATGGRVEALTARQVVQLGHDGVAPLRELVERSADALGIALARLTLLVDPARIILGGPLGVAGMEFIEGARWRMGVDLRDVSASWKLPEVTSAQFEPHSALRGAWLLACNLALDNAR